jgi:hypothetical protein
MVFHNLLGEREAQNQNSNSYKSAIADYLKERSFILIKDSSIDGCLSDLIFRRPVIDGERETWVEAKFTDLSLYDKAFLSELGRYFLKSMQCPEDKRFHFCVFVRKLKGLANWKKVFEKIDGPEINKLLLKVEEAAASDEERAEIKKHGYDSFLTFIQSSELNQADYKTLVMKADELKKSKKFDTSAKYLVDKSEILNEKEDITPNFIKVTGMPGHIWVADSKKIKDVKKFWADVGDRILRPYKNKIFSLDMIKSSSPLMKYVLKGKVDKIPFEEWDADETTKKEVLRQLIRKFIVAEAKSHGCRYDPKLCCLFFDHLNRLEKVKKVSGRMVAKQYRDKKGGINFVVHYGVRFLVRMFGDDFHIVLKPIRLFTVNGRRIIRGKPAQALHYKFPARFEYNNTEKSKFEFWCRLLSFNTQSLFGKNYFYASSPLKFSIDVKPKIFLKYDTVQEKDGGLSDFMDNERSDV